MSCEQCKKTGMCQKKSGLPIFLARYGIATKLGPEASFFPEKGAAYHYYNKKMGAFGNSYHEQECNISESKAPEISGKFKKPNISLDNSQSTLFYTLRTMRSCYLYVYDEARDDWQAYFVTESAFLNPLPGPYYDPSTKLTSDNPDKKPCQAQNFAQAGYITIREPSEASNIWITFSDVEWTEDVFDRYNGKSKEAQAYRLAHMRKFDVKKWMDTGEHDHAAKIADLAKHVADFAEGVNENAFFFSTSANERHAFPRLAWTETFIRVKDSTDPERYVMNDEEHHQELERLKQKGAARHISYPALDSGGGAGTMFSAPATARIVAASERILPGKGVVIALDDPVGITRELAELIAHRVAAFAMQPRYMKKLIASANIITAKQIVRDQAASDVVQAAEKFEEWRKAKLETIKRINRDDPYARSAVFLGAPNKENIFLEEEVRILTKDLDIPKLEPIPEKTIEARIEEKQAEVWKKYEKLKGADRFNERDRIEFVEKKYTEAIAPYLRDIIAPISQAHAQWLGSEELANRFICNFSTEVPEQGAEYPYILSLCIADGVDKEEYRKPAMDVVAKWMEGKLTDERNLLLRAIVLNHDEIAELIEAHGKESEEIVSLIVHHFPKLFKSSTTDEDIKKDNEFLDISLAREVYSYLEKFASLWRKTSRYSKPIVANTKGAATAIEQLIGQVSSAFDTRLMAESARKNINSFLTAVCIYTNSQIIAPTLVGTKYQHRELMLHTILNSPEADLAKAGQRYIIPPRTIPAAASPVKIDNVSLLRIDALVEYIDQLKTIEEGAMRYGDLKIAMQMLANKLSISPEALNDLYEFSQIQTGADFARFCRRARIAQSVQSEVFKTEKLYGELGAARENVGAAQTRLDEANARARTAQDSIDRSKEEIRRAGSSKGGYAASKNIEGMARADERLGAARISREHADRALEQARTDISTQQRALDTARADIIEKQNAYNEARSKAFDADARYTEQNQKLRAARRAGQLGKVPRKIAVDGSFAVVSHIMTIVSIRETWRQLGTAALWGKEWQTVGRFGGLVLSTIAATAQLALSSLKVGGHLAFTRRFAVSARWVTRTGLRWGIKWLGAPGGAIGGVVDVWDAIKERNKGNWGLAFAYASSGVIALIGAGIIIFGIKAMLLACIMLAVSFATSLILGKIKDDKLQDYLRFCAFGAEPRGWTAKMEQQAFQDALAF